MNITKNTTEVDWNKKAWEILTSYGPLSFVTWYRSVPDEIQKRVGLSKILTNDVVKVVLMDKAKEVIAAGGGLTEFLAWYHGLPFAVCSYLRGNWDNSHWVMSKSRDELLKFHADNPLRQFIADARPVIVFPTTFSAVSTEGKVPIGIRTGKETPAEEEQIWEAWRDGEPTGMRIHSEHIALFAFKKPNQLDELFKAIVMGNEELSRVALEYYDSLGLPESFEVKRTEGRITITITLTLQRGVGVALLPQYSHGLKFVENKL